MKRSGDIISLAQLAPEPLPTSLRILEYARDLAEIITEDEELGRVLGWARYSRKETAHTVLSHAQKWCEKNDAFFFAIICDQKVAIGTISLSHVDLQGRSASTGYWIGTRFQRHGYGEAAFHSLIAFARSLGIRSLQGRIGVDNYASQRIWERHGAEFERDGATLMASLLIER